MGNYGSFTIIGSGAVSATPAQLQPNPATMAVTDALGGQYETVATADTPVYGPTACFGIGMRCGALTTYRAQIAGKTALTIGGFDGIFTHANTANRTYTLPDATGTVPLTSNLPLSANATLDLHGHCSANLPGTERDRGWRRDHRRGQREAPPAASVGNANLSWSAAGERRSEYGEGVRVCERYRRQCDAERSFVAGSRAAVNSARIRAGKSPRVCFLACYRRVTGDSLASYCRSYRMAGSKTKCMLVPSICRTFFGTCFQNRGGGPTRGFMFRAEIWLRGMLAAVISGGANGVITGFAAIGIDPTHFNLAAGFVHTLSLAGVSAVMSGIIGVAAYLKQSPLPGEGTPGEYDQHDRYDAASRRHGARHDDNAHEGNAHEGNADERREIPEAQSDAEHPGERRGEHSSVEHAASGTCVR